MHKKRHNNRRNLRCEQLETRELKTTLGFGGESTGVVDQGCGRETVDVVRYL